MDQRTRRIGKTVLAVAAAELDVVAVDEHPATQPTDDAHPAPGRHLQATDVRCKAPKVMDLQARPCDYYDAHERRAQEGRAGTVPEDRGRKKQSIHSRPHTEIAETQKSRTRGVVGLRQGSSHNGPGDKTPVADFSCSVLVGPTLDSQA